MSFVPGDIHDIRGPIAIDVWWRWPLVFALATVVALIVVALLLRVGSRRRRQPSPLERAREALRVAEECAEAGRAREWAMIVAPLIREGVAARLGAAVLPETTPELSARLWAAWSYEGPVAPHEGEPRPLDAPRIVALLELCDAARFARADFPSSALVSQTAAARSLVEALLAPAPSPAAASARAMQRTTGVVGAVTS